MVANTEAEVIRHNNMIEVDSVCIYFICRNITIFGSCEFFDEMIYLHIF